MIYAKMDRRDGTGISHRRPGGVSISHLSAELLNVTLWIKRKDNTGQSIQLLDDLEVREARCNKKKKKQDKE